MAGFFADSVRLSLIFGDALCHVSSIYRLWILDQAYAYCELAERHRVGLEQSRLLVEAESRRPLKWVLH